MNVHEKIVQIYISITKTLRFYVRPQTLKALIGVKTIQMETEFDLAIT